MRTALDVQHIIKLHTTTVAALRLWSAPLTQSVRRFSPHSPCTVRIHGITGTQHTRRYAPAVLNARPAAPPTQHTSSLSLYTTRPSLRSGQCHAVHRLLSLSLSGLQYVHRVCTSTSSRTTHPSLRSGRAVHDSMDERSAHIPPAAQHNVLGAALRVHCGRCIITWIVVLAND